MRNRILLDGAIGLVGESGPDGMKLDAVPCGGAWLKLTANTGGGSYDWTEVTDAPSGAWVVTTNTGSLAWEINLNATLTAGYYVRAVKGSATGEWRFLAGPC